MFLRNDALPQLLLDALPFLLEEVDAIDEREHVVERDASRSSSSELGAAGLGGAVVDTVLFARRGGWRILLACSRSMERDLWWGMGDRYPYEAESF